MLHKKPFKDRTNHFSITVKSIDVVGFVFNNWGVLCRWRLKTGFYFRPFPYCHAHLCKSKHEPRFNIKPKIPVAQANNDLQSITTFKTQTVFRWSYKRRHHCRNILIMKRHIENDFKVLVELSYTAYNIYDQSNTTGANVTVSGTGAGKVWTREKRNKMSHKPR